MGSLLFANATDNNVGKQDRHTQKKPENNVDAYVSLSSVPSAKDGKSVVGILLNSGTNHKNILKCVVISRNFAIFSKSKVSDRGSTGIKLALCLKTLFSEIWNLFKMMSSLEIQLLPFEYPVLGTKEVCLYFLVQSKYEPWLGCVEY